MPSPQNYSCPSVMVLAVPVAVRFLQRGNRELSRNMSSYLSLAAIAEADLLADHTEAITLSVLAGRLFFIVVVVATKQAGFCVAAKQATRGIHWYTRGIHWYTLVYTWCKTAYDTALYQASGGHCVSVSKTLPCKSQWVHLLQATLLWQREAHGAAHLYHSWWLCRQISDTFVASRRRSRSK